MSEHFYTQVPSNPGHDHFANANIDSFPDLHAHHTFEDREAFIHHSLVSQLASATPENVRKYINMRECFKFQQRPQVEFCLNQKVPGTSFVEAASQLGYRKF